MFLVCNQGRYYSKCAKFQLPRGFKEFLELRLLQDQTISVAYSQDRRCNKVI